MFIYEREIGHCGPSPYVKLVTIATVEAALNSDMMDSVTFEETGRFAIVKRGQYKPGDKVTFIPAESVLPLELSEALGVTKYLSKGRVRVVRLRGNRSEGLVAHTDIVDPYIPYIMKWEDPPTFHMSGNPMRRTDIPPEFEKFYKMPNILDEPRLFRPGEHLFYSEKIHGTNCRFGFYQNPNTGKWELYVGSHSVVLRPDSGGLYWRVVTDMLSKIGVYPNNLGCLSNITFYGEIYGRGVQHLHYDTDVPSIKLFAATRRYDYISVPELHSLCENIGLPVVNHHRLTFTNLEDTRTIADSPSELTNSHEREGIVIVSAEDPSVMAKCISFNYLTKNGRTERR